MKSINVEVKTTKRLCVPDLDANTFHATKGICIIAGGSDTVQCSGIDCFECIFNKKNAALLVESIKGDI